MESLKALAQFPGIEYQGNKLEGEYTRNLFKKEKYCASKTVGFYELRNAMSNLKDTFNTYLFVSDANAPVPMYQVDTDDWNTDDWGDPTKVETVSKSMFLWQDWLIFDDLDLGGATLPAEIQTAITDTISNSAKILMKNGVVGSPTWKTLALSNLGYHASVDVLSDMNRRGFNVDNIGNSIYAVFGSMHNPYTSNNVVWATRDTNIKFPVREKSWGRTGK